MAWLRIDDRVRTHPKVAQAGPAAAWLWFCGICYCREHLTDGFIPKAAVTSLAMNLPNPFKHAARLVEVRLWEDALGGFQVHDFLDWNPSKAEVLTIRTAEAERKRTGRGVRSESERRPAGQAPESSHGRAGDAGLGSLPGSGLEVGNLEESARETEPDEPVSDVEPVWRKRDVPIPQASGLAEGAARHGMHAWCCDRGLCVPLGLHAQFKGRLQGDDADRDTRLKAFYQRTIDAIAGVEVSDRLYPFWENAFTHWIAPVTQARQAPQTATKGTRNADAWDDAAAALEARRK